MLVIATVLTAINHCNCRICGTFSQPRLHASSPRARRLGVCGVPEHASVPRPSPSGPMVWGMEFIAESPQCELV